MTRVIQVKPFKEGVEMRIRLDTKLPALPEVPQQVTVVVGKIGDSITLLLDGKSVLLNVATAKKLKEDIRKKLIEINEGI